MEKAVTSPVEKSYERHVTPGYGMVKTIGTVWFENRQSKCRYFLQNKNSVLIFTVTIFRPAITPEWIFDASP